MMRNEYLNPIIEKLRGGDLRSIGKANEVVADIFANPALFDIVFDAMACDDPVIRMRAADVIEKVSRQHPEYLQPYKHQLIHELSNIEQQEMRWHVAQLFSYLSVDASERDHIVKILLSYLESATSTIVIVTSLQTLADFAERDATIRPLVIKIIQEKRNSGSPAIVSRCKKLLIRLEK